MGHHCMHRFSASRQGASELCHLRPHLLTTTAGDKVYWLKQSANGKNLLYHIFIHTIFS